MDEAGFAHPADCQNSSGDADMYRCCCKLLRCLISVLGEDPWNGIGVLEGSPIRIKSELAYLREPLMALAKNIIF